MNIYIYKEEHFVKTKIDNPFKNQDHICLQCEYGLEPNKCYSPDVVVIGGKYKGQYTKLSKKDLAFIDADKNCIGFKEKEVK